MPFPFDMSQIFWGLMNKTMWDCRFGNMNGFNGFNGGFMNSCWGGGFQMPTWGDTCSFSSSGGSSSLTAEERVEKRKSQEKYTALKAVIQDYINTLTGSADKDLKMLLEEKLKDCGSSYSEANYEKLTDLYDEYKDKIQKKLKPDTEIEVKTESKTAATEFAKSSPNFKSILKVDGEQKTTAELKDGVDAMGFLYSLQTTNKKSFKTLYNTAFNAANDTKKAEMKKVLEAVYKSLTKEALEVKKQDGLSDETKDSMGKLLEIADSSATPDNVDQLYYWIRMAKAEIADSKYAVLQEDFPDDPLLGKPTNGVEATTAALKTEGLEPEKVRTQTVVTNYGDMENDTARMSSLVDKGLVKALDKNQLKALNAIAGVKSLVSGGIKKAWVDDSSRYNYKVIRIIDAEGNMKVINGVGLKDNEIKTVGGDIKIIDSITPEQIEARSQMTKAVEAAKDTLQEVQAKPDGTRVFEEKIATGERHYKRLFIIDNDGNLKEWQGVWLDSAQGFLHIQGSETPNVDANLDDIKTAVAAQPELNAKAEEAEAKKYWSNLGPTSRGIAESFYQALDGYTYDSDWENFDKEMKKVNKYNALVVLKAYTEKQNEHEQTKWSFDGGFFEQIYNENTGKGRRKEIVNKMKTYILEYVDGRLPLIQNKETKVRITTLRDEISKLDTTSCCHETVETAKTLDKKVAELCQLFDIK